MPNHCQNQLTVTGKAKDLKKFNEWFDKESFCEKIEPMPKELSDSSSPNKDEALAKKFTEKYGAPDWYLWAVQNWGTKWDIYDVEDKLGKTQSDIFYMTAWGPCLIAITKVSKKFPALKFVNTYYEGGMVFAGIFTAVNGEVDDNDIDPESPLFKEIAVSFGYEEEEEEEEELETPATN